MTAHAQASVRGLIEDDGAYLFVQHEMETGPIWGVPGGRAEIGEPPREAVAREVYEETRLEVAVTDPLEAYAYTWNGGDRGVVSTVFECELLGGTVDIESNPVAEPIVDYAWLEPGELEAYPMNETLRALLTRTDR